MSSRHYGRNGCLILYLGLAVLVGFRPSMAQEGNDDSLALAPDTLPGGGLACVVSIERVIVGDMRINDTLMIYLQSPGVKLAGFDFKVGTDGKFFDIAEVLPGEIYDSCGWEFFNARRIDNQFDDAFPKTLWQAVALAEVSVDTVRPLCYGFDRKASLLKLVVSNDFVAQVPDTMASIFFFWEDCTDNTMSNVGGDTLLLSYRVIDHYQLSQSVEGDPFPTVTGAPGDCVRAGRYNRPLRRIEFRNGGVEFRLDLGLDSSRSERSLEN